MSENEHPDIDFKDEEQNNWFIIVIVVIIMAILFVINFKFKNVKEEFKLSAEEAKRRHDRLLKHIEKKEGLKTKLDNKFKNYYLFARIGFVLIWFIILTILVFAGLIKNLGDALNYSEVLILLLILFNFIAFGSLKRLDDFVDYIKLTIKNLIYKKYEKLDKQIGEHKAELVGLEEIIDENQTEISSFQHNND